METERFLHRNQNHMAGYLTSGARRGADIGNYSNASVKRNAHAQSLQVAEESFIPFVMSTVSELQTTQPFSPATLTSMPSLVGILVNLAASESGTYPRKHFCLKRLIESHLSYRTQEETPSCLLVATIVGAILLSWL